MGTRRPTLLPAMSTSSTPGPRPPDHRLGAPRRSRRSSPSSRSSRSTSTASCSTTARGRTRARRSSPIRRYRTRSRSTSRTSSTRTSTSRPRSSRGCRPNLKPLASPLAGLIKERTPQIVSEVLARPRVQSLFVNVSQVAHEKLVNVLENKTGFGISTGNGVVTLDLSQLLTEVGTEVGVPQAALEQAAARRGPDHAPEVGPARRCADRGAGDPRAERLAARSRLRPLRRGHLPRPRLAPGRPAAGRLGARPRRRPRPDRAQVHGQLRHRRPVLAPDGEAGPPHLADRDADPRPDRLGGRPLRRSRADRRAAGRHRRAWHGASAPA